MKRLGHSIMIAAVLLCTVLVIAGAQEPGATRYVIGDPVTTIVVNSGRDPDASMSTICSGQPLCTLRRAIVESRGLSAAELPVLIKFDIPEDAAEGYNSSLDIWELEVYSTTDLYIYRRLKGQVIIDGSTQPGGRTDGPKIIVIGPGTGQKQGLVVGDIAGDDQIEIRGLGFQNLATHMYVNTDFNVIEDNWFGLTSNGRQPFLRNDEPEDGSGSAGIAMASGSNDNLIRNNVFLGFDGVAIAVRGEDNTVRNNLIGTRSGGDVPKVNDPDLVCTTVDWLGGGGISIDGEGHNIVGNTIAGLRQELFVLSTQPNGVTVAGDHITVRDNFIGVDGTGQSVGVCGRGIYVGGANVPQFTLISGNTIVNPESSAVSINGILIDATTLADNIIKQEDEWPVLDDNNPENAVQFGPSVPDALRLFNSARVTSIDGLDISGRAGANSPCPNCVIEIYLDDRDAVTETLKLAATATANGEGRWSATLAQAVGPNQGLRTASTTAQFNTIPNMSAGTTGRLSMLYLPAGGGEDSARLFLPLMMKP